MELCKRSRVLPHVTFEKKFFWILRDLISRLFHLITYITSLSIIERVKIDRWSERIIFSQIHITTSLKQMYSAHVPFNLKLVIRDHQTEFQREKYKFIPFMRTFVTFLCLWENFWGSCWKQVMKFGACSGSRRRYREFKCLFTLISTNHVLILSYLEVVWKLK